MKDAWHWGRGLREASRRSREQGCRPTRHLLLVSVALQRMLWLERTEGWSYRLVKYLVVSTSRFGIGQIEGSNCTPLGLHRVAGKVGAGWPVGTVFRSRQPVGWTWQGLPQAPIAHRILWLEGLEPGWNRGGQVDSHSRYIYIHGVGPEEGLGRPASHGCVHVASGELLPLFDRIPEGTLVYLQA